MDFEFRLLAAEAAMATGRVAWGTQQYARAAAGRAGLPANLVARMGLASLDRPSEALAILEAGMHASPRTADDAFVLGLAGQVAAVLGDLATAQGYAERGLALAQAHGWPWPEAEAALSLGLIAARRGDVELARAEYRTAGSAAERGGNVAQLATTAIRVATLLVASGRYSEAVGELDRGLDLAEAAGMPSLVAWGRSVRADAHLGLGRLDDAQIDAETARDIHERFGMTIVVRSLRCLGDVHRTRGELALARAAYEGALRRDSPDHRLDRAAALAGLARIVVAMDAEAGEALVCEATSLAEATPVEPFALLSAGWVSLWRGDPRGATRYAETAAAEARRRDGQPDIAESLELRAAALERPVDRLRLLDEAAELWRSLGNPLAMARVALAAARFSDRPRAAAVAAAAEQQLRSLGVRLASVGGAAGLLAFVPWPDSAPVAIQTLGEFKVLRGGVPAGTGDWRRSRKAQQLLKILVTRRGRSLSRDALMEELWPETAPGDLTNRLSVALNTVRHVLDPDRRLPADHYVRSDGDRIAIDLSRLPIDLERFQALADGGLSLRERDPVNARQLLEAAEAAYAGDYLGGDLDNDSAAAVRDEALASYKRVARALAALATARGDRERVVHHLARMFERDPYDEAAHLELVAALVRFGERGEARRRYAAYVDRMAELATEPAPFPSDEPAPVTSRQV
jgi:DNA-binding SARP family transcriptional activator